MWGQARSGRAFELASCSVGTNLRQQTEVRDRPACLSSISYVSPAYFAIAQAQDFPREGSQAPEENQDLQEIFFMIKISISLHDSIAMNFPLSTTGGEILAGTKVPTGGKRSPPLDNAASLCRYSRLLGLSELQTGRPFGVAKAACSPGGPTSCGLVWLF
jgi:hypothetical protein